MQRDRVLFDLIEECGGRIVLDATETGRRGQRRGRSTADGSPKTRCWSLPTPTSASRMRRAGPIASCTNGSREQLAQAGARGIVFHHYVWCDTWRAEFARLKEWADLPVLGLDSDGDGETNVARLRTRDPGFLEMLQ